MWRSSARAAWDYPMITADGKKIAFTRNDKSGDIFLLENPDK